jgi:exopolysaccharide biosynthesis polyprenyl glycosylphosphotransferase
MGQRRPLQISGVGVRGLRAANTARPVLASADDAARLAVHTPVASRDESTVKASPYISANLPVRRPRRNVWDGALLVAADVVSAVVLAAALSTFTWGALASVVLMLGSAFMSGAYRRPRVALSALADMRATIVTASGPLMLSGFAASVNHALSSTVRYAGALIPAVAAGRVAAYHILRATRRRGWGLQPTVIVGAGVIGNQLSADLREHPECGLDVVGVVDTYSAHERVPADWLGPVDQLDRVLRETNARRAIVTFTNIADSDVSSTLRSLTVRGVEILVVPRLFEFGSAAGDTRTQECRGVPLVWLPHREWRVEQLAIKRTFDIVVALAAMIVTLPILLVAAVAVQVSSGGPIFYRQARVGKNGRVFMMLKFRTMRVAYDVQGDADEVPLAAPGGAGDPRITRVGAFMRRWSIDELPQFWNVIKGDMSVVGPRPERPHYVELLEQSIPGYRDRHRAPCGLTGWAQINRLRGADTSLEDRARLDNFYIEHWSLWRDAVILVRTITAIKGK